MKNALLAAVVLLAFVAPASKAQLGVGAKAGLNLATVSSDPEFPGTKSRTAFMVGGVFETGVGSFFFVSAEPMYVQKGVQQEGTIFVDENGQPVNGKSTSRVSEIEIPVLFKAKFLPGPVRPFAFAGPSIGFVLSAKDEYEPVGFATQEVDLKENTSSVDFGLIFGGGAEFRVAPAVGLTVDARYSLGLSDLAKETVPGAVDQKVRTRGFQILAGVLFSL